jgi:poly(A) polymerase
MTEEVEFAHLVLESILSEDLQLDQAEKRQIILDSLINLLDEWAVRILESRHVLVQEDFCAVKLFTFGSFRLGTNDTMGDIDTLCLVSRVIQFNDFCGSLSQCISGHPLVTKFMIVPEAFVPVMKFHFNGIPIDMVFAQFSRPLLPKNINLANLDQRDLQLLDMRSLYGVNGCRVTDEFYRLVPNFPTFQNAVRFIKKWAKARSIYSNSMGFLGGISWAILTARVCQVLPNASLSTIILETFKFLHEWNWPEPIFLDPLQRGGPLGNLVWDPYYNDDLMPIVTHAYPAMNSADKVSKSTKKIILDEAERAQLIFSDVLSGKKTCEDLFQRTIFL